MAATLTADKVLTLDIEGVELTQAWDTSAAVTLAKMAEQIQALGTVLTAVAGDGTDAGETKITITGANDGDSITQSAMLEVTAGGNLSSTTITTLRSIKHLIHSTLGCSHLSCIRVKLLHKLLKA